MNMKKLIVSVSLGTLLAAGLFFTIDNPTDQVARDIEPSIYSIGNPTF
ncbi:hypothetical protein [Virgibacillus phasianinus]|nr:hypothetical protein [Virgibacillus phasianinus]